MYICSGSQRPFKERSITIPCWKNSPCGKNMGFWLPKSTFNNSVFWLGDLPPQKKCTLTLSQWCSWSPRPVVGADFLVFGPLVGCIGAVWHVAVTPSGNRKDKASPLTRGEPAVDICWRQLEVLGFETWPEYGRSKMCIIDINYYNFSICYSFVAWTSWGFTISQFRSCFCLMRNCVEDKWFLNNIITIWLLRFIVSSLHMYYIITSLNCYVHFFRVKYGGLKLPLLWWVGIFGCLRRWRIAPHQRLGCTQRFNVYWLGSVLSTFYDLIQTSDL